MRTLTDFAEDLVALGLDSHDTGKVSTYVHQHLAEAITAYIINPDAAVDLAGALAGFVGDEPFACLTAAAKLAATRERAIDDIVEKVLYRMDCILDSDPLFPCPAE